MIERDMKPGYCYRARLDRVVDGDTIDVDLDLGFGVWLKGQRLRLEGIDTPEVRGEEREEGLRSKDFVIRALQEVSESGTPKPRDLIVETFKDKRGKYGRWIAIVWYQTGPETYRNLNEELVAHGLAKFTYYK